MSSSQNWLTDPQVALGGYFNHLASHGLDLLIYFLGEIQEARGISLNQQGLYDAKDAVSACWLHQGGVTRTGVWNFGVEAMDRVEIFGNKDKIIFSVFEENPLISCNEKGELEISIDHPEHVQLPHVENIKKHLFKSG